MEGRGRLGMDGIAMYRTVLVGIGMVVAGKGIEKDSTGKQRNGL